MATCTGCGARASDETPVPNHCGECPPWKCEDCGGTNSLAENISCPCWVSLEGMALADIKALFAASDLSIDIPRETP